MAQRADQKERSHKRIVAAAAERFREDGLLGAGVDAIMGAAGLTHGGFYAHFRSKSALIAEAVADALAGTRRQWFTGLENVAPGARVASIASRYLNAAHRDDIGTACVLPALGGEIARQSDDVREAFSRELAQTLDALTENMPGPDAEHAAEQAVGALAACVGGMVLARAVSDRKLSDRILRSSRGFILRGVARSKTDIHKETR